MPGDNPQQSDRGTLRMSPPLLPVPEGVNADTHGASELGLGQPDKRRRAAMSSPDSNWPNMRRFRTRMGNGPHELFVGQLWTVTHKVYMAEL